MKYRMWAAGLALCSVVAFFAWIEAEHPFCGVSVHSKPECGFSLLRGDGVSVGHAPPYEKGPPEQANFLPLSVRHRVSAYSDVIVHAGEQGCFRIPWIIGGDGKFVMRSILRDDHSLHRISGRLPRVLDGHADMHHATVEIYNPSSADANIGAKLFVGSFPRNPIGINSGISGADREPEHCQQCHNLRNGQINLESSKLGLVLRVLSHAPLLAQIFILACLGGLTGILGMKAAEISARVDGRSNVVAGYLCGAFCAYAAAVLVAAIASGVIS